MTSEFDVCMTLFVAGEDPQAQQLVERVRKALAEISSVSIRYQLDVVDILLMPEKALEKDVFATPMLGPVLN